MTLRTKFQLASTSLILIVVIGMMGSLFVSEKKRIWEQIQSEQEQELQKLALVSDESNLQNLEMILLNYVQTLIRSDERVAYAGPVNPNEVSWVYTKGQDEIAFVSPDNPNIEPILNSKGLLRRDLVNDRGERIMEITQPAYVPGPDVDGSRKQGYVRLGYSYKAVSRLFADSLKSTLTRFFWVGFVAIIFGLVLVQLFSAALSRPIDRLMHAALQIARGKKGVQVEESGSDELGRLTKTFNRMSIELTKLDELKDDFMSHVSHELRSPLTSIIATVELLKENPLTNKDPKFKRSVDRLDYGSERLNRLVDNILDLTRMQAGKMPFDIQPTEIPRLVRDMADFFEPRAMEKGLKISSIVPNDLPKVMCDPEKIRQVLSNLIHNAIKFTNSGGIILSACETGDRQMVQVSVQDTGVGIAQDKLGSIFGRFETLKDTKDRVDKPVPGSGLGLNIVKNSIEAQGGRIWVESELNQGSTFKFTLPVAKEDKKSTFADRFAVKQKPAIGNGHSDHPNEEKAAI